MDEKDNPARQPQAADQPAGADKSDEATAKQAYKSPTIKRHGNLRLMTQLE